MSDNTYDEIYGKFEVTYYDKKLEGDSSFVEHYHDAYELVFYTKADIQIFIKDKRYEIRDGDMLFINEYEIHRMVYYTNTQYARYVINFKKEFLLSFLKFLNIEFLLERIKAAHCIKAGTNLIQRDALEMPFKSIYKIFSGDQNNEDSMTRALILSNLLLILCSLNEAVDNCRHAMKYNKKDMQVHKIISFIDSNYMSPVDLNILEDRFYISKYHISHIFRKITGFSVMEYIQYRRIIEAQKLLKNSSRDIIDICFDCGFNNIQHFYRTFKKISKVSPYKYRKFTLKNG